jgi:hypothetical protein
MPLPYTQTPGMRFRPTGNTLQAARAVVVCHECRAEWAWESFLRAVQAVSRHHRDTSHTVEAKKMVAEPPGPC